MDLKIITYNIHKGFGRINFRFILNQIRKALEDINPDLIFLQEIQGKHIKRNALLENWPDKPQYEFLAENLWPYYIYGKNALYEHGHHGNAFLSKFTILKSENINVTKHKRASRSLLHSILNIDKVNATIHVICVHLSIFKSEQRKQLLTLKNRIIKHIPEDKPLIIAGDFNDWRNQATHYLEEELNLKEAFKTTYGEYAKTFPSRKPKYPVDRIYYRNLKLKYCECLSKKPWNKLSDHFPLYAKFTL